MNLIDYSINFLYMREIWHIKLQDHSKLNTTPKSYPYFTVDKNTLHHENFNLFHSHLGVEACVYKPKKSE